MGDRLPRPLKRRELLVIGVSLENDPFRGPIRRAIEDARPRLTEPRCVLLDELSNLDFGWPLVGRFDGWEMGRTAVRVVGGFPLLRGFAADGVAICRRRELRAALRTSDDRADPVRLPEAQTH